MNSYQPSRPNTAAQQAQNMGTSQRAGNGSEFINAKRRSEDAGILSPRGFRPVGRDERAFVKMKSTVRNVLLTVAVIVVLTFSVPAVKYAYVGIQNGYDSISQHIAESRERRRQEEQAAEQRMEQERLSHVPEYARAYRLSDSEYAPFFFSGSQSYERIIANALGTIAEDSVVQNYFREYAELVQKANESEERGERLAAAQLLSLIARVSRLHAEGYEQSPVYTIFTDLFDSERGIRQNMAEERQSSAQAMLQELLDPEQSWHLPARNGGRTYYRQLMNELIAGLEIRIGTNGLTAIDPSTEIEWWRFDEQGWRESAIEGQREIVRLATGRDIEIRESATMYYVRLRNENRFSDEKIYGISKRNGEIVEIIYPQE